MNRLVEELPTLLPEWLPHQRWFGAKGRPVPLGSGGGRHTAHHRGRSAPRPRPPARRVRQSQRRRRALLPAARRPLRRSARRAGARHVRRHRRAGGLRRAVGPALTQWLLDRRWGRAARSAACGSSPSPTPKIAERGAGRVLGVEPSNTSVSWGERSILKLFRRVLPGLNPDLEVHRALRSVNGDEVAALQGAVEGTFDGEPFTLAMLQDFAANSADGWSMALASVRDLLAEADLRADEVGGDFAGEASRLGETVAVVHDELRRALGETSRDARELAAVWHERLGATVAEVPVLAPYVDGIRATYDAVAGLADGDADPAGARRPAPRADPAHPAGLAADRLRGRARRAAGRAGAAGFGAAGRGGHAALVRLRGVPPDPGPRARRVETPPTTPSSPGAPTSGPSATARPSARATRCGRAPTPATSARCCGRSSWTRRSTSCCTRPAAARPGPRSPWRPSPACPRSPAQARPSSVRRRAAPPEPGTAARTAGSARASATRLPPAARPGPPARRAAAPTARGTAAGSA